MITRTETNARPAKKLSVWILPVIIIAGLLAYSVYSSHDNGNGNAAQDTNASSTTTGTDQTIGGSTSGASSATPNGTDQTTGGTSR